MKYIIYIWERYKKIVILASLTIIMMYQLVSLFFPNFFNINICLFVICAALIVIFDYVCNINIPSKFNSSNNFSEGFTNMLLNDKNIDSLDVFSDSSTQYYYSVKESGVKISKLRILVCERNEQMNVFNKSTDILHNRNYQFQLAIQGWCKLVREGQIQEIQIHKYHFEPMYHFAILNNKYFHFGMFKMEKETPNVLLSHYTALELDATTKSMIYDFTKYFNEIFANFSECVDLSPNL